MQERTTELIQPQLPLDEIPYGYCHCGCGQKTSISPKSNRKRGLKKGEPVRYISGHSIGKHPPVTNEPNPNGLCMCGCGQPTPPGKETSRRRGLIKGQPVRFIHGHYGKLSPEDGRNPTGLCMCGCGKPVKTGKYPSEQRCFLRGHGRRKSTGDGPNPGGLCACGCGRRTPLAKQDSLRRGLVRGKPIRFLCGHSRRRSAVDRFWEKVNKCGPDECWEWQAGRNHAGYGEFSNEQKQELAHRFSYKLHYGPIPDGKEVCHKCDNPPCTNPFHLFAGSRYDNIIDMYEKGRDKRTRLHTEHVIEIRRLCASGEKQSNVARRFGVAKGTISEIVHRKTFKHVE